MSSECVPRAPRPAEVSRVPPNFDDITTASAAGLNNDPSSSASADGRVDRDGLAYAIDLEDEDVHVDEPTIGCASADAPVSSGAAQGERRRPRKRKRRHGAGTRTAAYVHEEDVQDEDAPAAVTVPTAPAATGTDHNVLYDDPALRKPRRRKRRHNNNRLTTT